jgi:hypothetical protein
MPIIIPIIIQIIIPLIMPALMVLMGMAVYMWRAAVQQQQQQIALTATYTW